MIEEAALNQLKQQFGIIGNDPALNRAIDIAAQVAATELSVVITGESGTGKESFSKLIHKLSPYKHGPFIALNCGAIPDGTIDSELFGHEKGAFTGASDARKGYFEEANGGTIFLDEIGDMPLNTQTKLLRVLEYGEFIKVGSSKIQKIKVRVLAATNKDLLEAVYQGKFREDLYYRLNTVPIRIPPLRERGQDILRLFAKFATEFADRYYVKPIQLTTDAQEILLQYRFPGNIRQLKNLVEQMAILAVDRTMDQEILLQYLPKAQQALPQLYQAKTNYQALPQHELWYQVLLELKKEVSQMKQLIFKLLKNNLQGNELMKDYAHLFQNVTDAAPSSGVQLLKQSKDYVHQDDAIQATDIEQEEALTLEVKEKELITKALKRHDNKRKKAAASLGISERTLYRKINQYDLEAN